MKSKEETMEILEAFDLSGSYRAAAELCGCSHHTVAHWVALRDQQKEMLVSDRERIIGPYLEKVEEWVERSKGKIRADFAHRKLTAMGFEGSERTVRRAVAEAKAQYGKGKIRIYRPWVPEPGMWFQFDWGLGPMVLGRETSLWCAWLAWSRFRVVIPTWDRTLPTVIYCIDQTLRAFGGVPTYGLTDNEKTVTTEHIARIAVRHPEIVAASRHYGLTIATCVPADPESKGGVEATVKIAKADLVPTETNLLDDYDSFVDLMNACRRFNEEVNARVHRETHQAPTERLQIERQRLHRLPDEPYTAAFGVTRRVSWSSLISFAGVRYSVPHTLAGQTVWARVHGEDLVAVFVDPKRGPVEVARHQVSVPGHPMIKDEHYPPRLNGPLRRQPVASTPEESEFLDIGEGAKQWLIEAAAAGSSRMRAKIDHAISLSRIYGAEAVDRALGAAAVSARFDCQDLETILSHQQLGAQNQLSIPSGVHTLQPGTSSWKGFGR